MSWMWHKSIQQPWPQALYSLWCFCCHGRPPAESRGPCSELARGPYQIWAAPRLLNIDPKVRLWIQARPGKQLPWRRISEMMHFSWVRGIKVKNTKPSPAAPFRVRKIWHLWSKVMLRVCWKSEKSRHLRWSFISIPCSCHRCETGGLRAATGPDRF